MADDVRDSIEVFDVEDANGDITEAVYLDQLEKWLAEHDREVARRAIFAASDEFMNGHQADRPHPDAMRTGVPTWFNRYAERHYGPEPADVQPCRWTTEHPEHQWGAADYAEGPNHCPGVPAASDAGGAS